MIIKMMIIIVVIVIVIVTVIVIVIVELRGSQGMGAVGTNWFDRALLSNSLTRSNPQVDRCSNPLRIHIYIYIYICRERERERHRYRYRYRYIHTCIHKYIHKSGDPLPFFPSKNRPMLHGDAAGAAHFRRGAAYVKNLQRPAGVSDCYIYIYIYINYIVL